MSQYTSVTKMISDGGSIPDRSLNDSVDFPWALLVARWWWGRTQDSCQFDR